MRFEHVTPRRGSPPRRRATTLAPAARRFLLDNTLAYFALGRELEVAIADAFADAADAGLVRDTEADRRAAAHAVVAAAARWARGEADAS